MKVILDSDKNAAIVLDDDNVFLSATTLANFGTVIASGNSSFDTGFMEQADTGILSYRVSGEYAQMVYQQGPAETLVKWGQYERDTGAKVYNVDMPYKIWIVDFRKDLLVGLRHFFSPIAMQEIDQPLYHTTFPNTNCTGYNGTSVGWVCLYRTGATPLLSVQDKLRYAFDRESGLSEPYNDANMSSTDGPRFYSRRKIDQFASGAAWVKASNEGIDWANVLIPIRTSDAMSTQHADKGQLYTMDRAMNAPYYPYYPTSLADEERAYYEAGWSSGASIMGGFDAKTLSKLGLVDPPKSLDVDEVLKTYSIRRKSNINFGVFDYDASYLVSQTVFAARSSCVLCGNHKGELEPLVDTFTVRRIEIEEEKKFAYDPYGKFMLLRYAISPTAKDEFLTVCRNCAHKGSVTKARFESNPDLGVAENTVEEVYVLTHLGYQTLMGKDLDLRDRYIDQTTATAVKYAHYVVSCVNVTFKVPTTSVVTCLHCEQNYYYEMNDDNMPDIEKFGIVSEAVSPQVNSWYNYKLERCTRCMPKASAWVVANETSILQSELSKFIIEEEHLFEGQVLNDLSYEVVFNKKPPTLMKASELWATELLSEDFGCTMIVDSKEKLLGLDRCECGFGITEDVNTTLIEGCQFRVCDTCVEDGCKYKAIIDH